MAFEYQNFSSLGVNLNRQKYGPLDISNVFKSEYDLNYYLSKGAITENVSEYWLNVVPYPYEGQIVALVSDTGATAFLITSWDETTEKFNIKAIEAGGTTAELEARVTTLESWKANAEPRLSTIEENYLSQDDTLIIYGGSATDNIPQSGT